MPNGCLPFVVFVIAGRGRCGSVPHPGQKEIKIVGRILAKYAAGTVFGGWQAAKSNTNSEDSERSF